MTCTKKTRRIQTPLPLEGWEAVVQAQHSGLPPDAMADLAAGRAKLIPLTQGKFAAVDTDDCKWLNRAIWSLHKNGYSHRTIRGGNKQKSFWMHRVILNPPPGYLTDHVNRIRLDNRRCNLRVANASESQWNKTVQSNNVTGIRGVSLLKRGVYEAAISKKRKSYRLGQFKTLKEATIVRRAAEVELHGGFAGESFRRHRAAKEARV